MSRWEILGRTLCAILSAAMIGGLTLLCLTHFFPKSPTGNLPFSDIAIIGSAFGGLTGAFIGWRWPVEIADSALGEIIGRILGGAISLLFKAF